MVVRSSGDTPGVVAFLAAHQPRGGEPILAGCGLLAIDPGGTHKHTLIDAREAVDAVTDPITHCALATLVTTTFMHTVSDLSEAQMFTAIAIVAARHEEFTDVNAARLTSHYTPAQYDAAVHQFRALVAERDERFDGTDDCGCMRCAVIADNQAAIEGQLTAEGTPHPAALARAVDELAALDAMVDEPARTRVQLEQERLDLARQQARTMRLADAHLLRRLFGGRNR
jgi:hypothetical protein